MFHETKRDPRHRLGAAGEQYVARHLLARGATIVGTNVRVGRLELDLVAVHGSTLIVCEVRARRRGALVSAIESIDHRKRERLRRAAMTLWLHEHRRLRLRIDCAALTVEPDGSFTLDYIEAAIERER